MLTQMVFSFCLFFAFLRFREFTFPLQSYVQLNYFLNSTSNTRLMSMHESKRLFSPRVFFWFTDSVSIGCKNIWKVKPKIPSRGTGALQCWLSVYPSLLTLPCTVLQHKNSMSQYLERYGDLFINTLNKSEGSSTQH